MRNKIGFKDYEIVNHSNEDNENKLTIKTVKDTIELTNTFSDIELNGLGLTKRNYVTQDGEIGSSIEGTFETVSHHDLIVLGKEFNENFHTKLSIRPLTNSTQEWLERIIKDKINLKIGEIELHALSEIKMSGDDKPICNSVFFVFFSDDVIHPMNEIILEIYLKKEIYDILGKYIEDNLIDKIQINTDSERIFRQDIWLPEYKHEDKYLLFGNDKYKASTLLAYSSIVFETKKRIEEDNYKDEYEKKDEEREKIIIKETKERNYENKFNFMIGLLIAITIILYLK